MLTLVCPTVYGVSRISLPDLKAVNFAKPIAGYKLNESVIKEIEVDSQRSCQFACVGKDTCQSYNFGLTNGTNPTKKNGKRFICQLSNSDRFVGFANFAEDKEFIYKGLQVKLNFDLKKKLNFKLKAHEWSFMIAKTLNFFINLCL